MTSNCRLFTAEKRSPTKAFRRRLFLAALVRVHRTASGLMSTAVTSAPALAAHKATTPDPHPISRRDFPARGSEEMNFARIGLDPKYLGWNTPGNTSRSRFATLVSTHFV